MRIINGKNKIQSCFRFQYLVQEFINLWEATPQVYFMACYMSDEMNLHLCSKKSVKSAQNKCLSYVFER
jgi:hypothetical protein